MLPFAEVNVAISETAAISIADGITGGIIGAAKIFATLVRYVVDKLAESRRETMALYERDDARMNEVIKAMTSMSRMSSTPQPAQKIGTP